MEGGGGQSGGTALTYNGNAYKIQEDCRIVTKFYKQLHITLQVSKIFQFLFRYQALNLNKEESETLKIKIELKTKKINIPYCIFFNGQNLLLHDWKFSKKNIFCYVTNSASCHICFQIEMCK